MAGLKLFLDLQKSCKDRAENSHRPLCPASLSVNIIYNHDTSTSTEININMMLTKLQILQFFHSCPFLFYSPIQDPMLHLVFCFFWSCILCVCTPWTILSPSYAWAFKHFLIFCNYKQCYTSVYIYVFSYCCGCIFKVN